MLAVFPLNIVVLPQEEVALHFFEPRYIELFADHRNGKEFVIQFNDDNESSQFGTTVIIKEVINEFPDGTVDLIVEGVAVVRIEQFESLYPNKLYSGVEVTKLEGDLSVPENMLRRFNTFLKNIGKQPKVHLSYSIFQLANRLEMNQESKNELISLFDYSKMKLFLINEIKFQENIRQQESVLQNKFHLN